MVPFGFSDLPDDAGSMRVAHALGEDLVLRSRLDLAAPRVEEALLRRVFGHATSCATDSTIWAAECSSSALTVCAMFGYSFTVTAAPIRFSTSPASITRALGMCGSTSLQPRKTGVPWKLLPG